MQYDHMIRNGNWQIGFPDLYKSHLLSSWLMCYVTLHQENLRIFSRFSFYICRYNQIHIAISSHIYMSSICWTPVLSQIYTKPILFTCKWQMNDILFIEVCWKNAPSLYRNILYNKAIQINFVVHSYTGILINFVIFRGSTMWQVNFILADKKAIET